MAPATTPKFIVCNIDGIPVGEYDSRDMAISACRDLALEAAHVGDTTNGYYIHDDEAFGGFLAVDVND